MSDNALPSTSTQRRRSAPRNVTITRTVQVSSMVLVTETEEGTYLPTSGLEENKTATWLNRIALALRSIHKSQTSGPQTRAKTKELTDVQRVWLSEFATRPAPIDLDMKMKPDIALLQKDPFDPKAKIHGQLMRKAYAVFVAQPGCRFVITLSILHLNFRLHLFDCSGAVHSHGHSIHCHADYFIRILYTLTFGPPELVGYDPTLFFSLVIARSPCPRTPPTIYIGNDLYIIICLLISNDLIHGRATLCFIVVKAPSKQNKHEENGKQYVVKSSWARIGRSNTEEEMLNRMEEKGLTYGVSNLIVAWTVQIAGVDDSTDLCRPDYILRHLIGMPLEDFSCIQELLSVLIDIVNVHEVLVLRCGILHRDISIRNILMYIFDYGKHCWPIRSKDMDVSKCLSVQEKIIQEHNFHCGLLIDFNYAKFLDRDFSISGGE
ncbi:hypothetical protein OG21DRAFT_1490957 [Imleria badia]|nr:hypothetical protein OG21DRAFT_1490957 [Imleria badia]